MAITISLVAALADAGLCVHFSAVAVKPGRPLTFATRPGAAVFGLPGNPVAVYVMFHLFVMRAAARMCGSPWTAREITLRLGREFRRRKSDRVEYVPCRIGDDGMLIPVEYHGSAHLTALSEADGLFIVPLGISSIPAGQSVRFLPIMIKECGHSCPHRSSDDRPLRTNNRLSEDFGYRPVQLALPLLHAACGRSASSTRRIF